MHLVVVPGEHRLADAFGRVLVHMLQEDVGVVDEELVGILQVLFRESVSVVVAAVVFFGGHTDDPEPGIAVILGDGIPKFLDFGGHRFGRRLDEGRDKARVDEADAGFAGFGDFVPEVDDLVHVWWLQFAPGWLRIAWFRQEVELYWERLGSWWSVVYNAQSLPMNGERSQTTKEFSAAR